MDIEDLRANLYCEIYPQREQVVITLKGLAEKDLERIQEIFNALLVSGGLTGVKGGKTVIHFDKDGVFQEIQLDYKPWMRRLDG